MTESSTTTDKSEIIDYLRNLQKAQEIHAKVNGINIWVLCGALAIVIWHFIDIFDVKWWINPDVPLRILMLTQLTHFLMLVAVPESGRAKEFRFMSTVERSPSVLALLWIVLQSLPAALLALLTRSTFASSLLLVLFASLLVYLIAVAVRRFFESDLEGQRFPGTLLAPPNVASKWFAILSVCLLLYAMASEVLILRASLSAIEVSLVKNVVLALTLFWLTYYLIHKMIGEASLSWTYTLEVNLVLGLISPSGALRRIEHRLLGPRLSMVTDDFFDGLDEKLERLGAAIVTFRQDAADIERIPADYPVERVSRVHERSRAASKELDSILSEHLAFADYVKKLRVRNSGLRPEVSRVLVSIEQRHKTYFDRTKALKDDYKAIIDSLLGQHPKASSVEAANVQEVDAKPRS